MLLPPTPGLGTGPLLGGGCEWNMSNRSFSFGLPKAL